MHTQFELPRSLKAAQQGRRLLLGLLDSVSVSVVTSALAVLTELVTNSVVHSSSDPDDPVEVNVALDDERLRVSVCDVESRLDPNIEPKPRDEGGWGLVIVDRLSSRWGVTVNDRSCVWAEFDLGQAAPE